MFGYDQPPGPPDQQRHHRQPRGSLRRPRDRTPARRSPTAPTPTTPTPDGHVLGIESVAVATTTAGSMDLDALEEPPANRRRRHRRRHHRHDGPRRGRPGPRDRPALPPLRRTGARRRRLRRVLPTDRRRQPRGVAAAPYAAIADADSVVIDPHKHGLQPYGCGAVIFRDPGRRHYLHDSPYTYFTSDELHLGEISPGVLPRRRGRGRPVADPEVLPLTPDGLGAVLRPGRRAALAWAGADRRERRADASTSRHSSTSSATSRPRPALGDRPAAAHVLDCRDARCRRTNRCSSPPTPSTRPALASPRPPRQRRRADGRILRSVLMKPETEQHVPALHQQLLDLLREAP